MANYWAVLSLGRQAAGTLEKSSRSARIRQTDFVCPSRADITVIERAIRIVSNLPLSHTVEVGAEPESAGFPKSPPLQHSKLFSFGRGVSQLDTLQTRCHLPDVADEERNLWNL